MITRFVFAFCFVLSALLANAMAVAVQEDSDTRFIPDNAVAALVAYPKTALAQPSMELFPHEIVTAGGQQALGVDPMQISEVVFLIAEPEEGRLPAWGGIVRFDEMMILGGEFTDFADVEEINGRKIYTVGGDLNIMSVDRQTFLFGTREMLVKMYITKSSTSQLATMIAATQNKNAVTGYVVMEPLRDLIKGMAGDANDVPEPFRKFLEIPDLIDTIQLTQQLNLQLDSGLIVTATDGNGQKLADTLQEALQLGQEFLVSQAQESMDMSDPVQQATVVYLDRVGNSVKQQLQPGVNGNVISYDAGYGVASLPAVTALLVPIIHQARSAARRTESANNLRQLLLAMHNYESAFQHFPNNVYDEEGNALLSWRVQLLPFVEANNLYDQFHMDEPWDSEHNIQLVEQMPEILKCPDLELDAGMTLYLAASGEGTIFDGPDDKNMGDVVDGLSNTIGLVEGNGDSAVIWTKPQDLAVDWEHPKNGIGGLRNEGFNAAFLDGSVRLINESVDPEALGFMFTIGGGEVLAGEDWDR